MQFDREIKVSIAGTRKATNWPTSTMLWSELCERLKTPVRSTESYAEYMALTKGRQDELKDVGGFVAGSFSGSRRKADSVLGRDVITLDLDNIPAGQTLPILQRVRSLGAGYCVYSTRKHHASAPRLRVLMPLSRTATADEYEPIARKLAEVIGIEFADPTTFQASRLMYFGSVSSDGEYIFEVGDGPFVDTDGMLSTYTDWRDITSWPQVPGAPEMITKRADKQQDPEEKKGVIGAFCRVYDIPAVIDKYLRDVYEEVPAMEGRYTFLGGSTTGGAVVYDGNKFIFSHHATDPASGQLCNSFDLVRLHLFGSEDDEVKPNTPVNRLPSFDLMCKLALNDHEVAHVLNEERYKEAVDAFNESDGLMGESAEVGDTSWMKALEVNSLGDYHSTIKNVYIILNNDPNLAGKLAFDEFSNRGLAIGTFPWDKRDGKRDWADSDDAGLRQYLESVYKITGRQKIDDAVTNTAMLHRFNDVKTYLSSLKWDGSPRIDSVFVDYFGADDNAYTRAISRKFFAAGAARVFKPGIKYDYMIIMVGPQGCGKSTFLARIGKRWYSDSLNTFEGKEASEAIQGVWINEVGELNGMTRSEVTAVKSFLSKQDDIYREAYGRRTVKFPRRCVFVGTTNDEEFLRDRTGNRRFWPVDLKPDKAKKNIFDDLTEEVVDQLWAEGLEAWRQGEQLFLCGEAEELSFVQQAAHMECHPWEGLVIEYLDKKIPLSWDSMSLGQRRAFLWDDFISEEELRPRQRVCAAEVWAECLGNDLKWIKRRDSDEITKILSGIPGWEKAANSIRFGQIYGKQRGFVRESQDPEPALELDSSRGNYGNYQELELVDGETFEFEGF